ncbi:hypothetical protein PN36_24765 [Candidatus Thiomargarita nelsonii]|uniref:DUF2149 domain-containing protein n=1 Tax=Candidatus Thiomargarita nelsonii TaxID=1003181 RepID=A0A0A6P7B5_9GAMM|nr:hypothetical protein PN36_24765 [Candidatus Thiomargarita nelsonii]
MNLLEDEDESNNPILSVVNIVDVFLVIIAALLIAIANNPFSPYNTENVVVVKNPGEENMEIIVKKGQEIEKYQSTGEIGQGQGVRAGIAYKMADGSFVYVPENGH